MKTIFFFLFVLVFFFILYTMHLFVKYRQDKLNKVGQYAYLSKKYKIDFNKLGPTKTIFILAFCNSLIIANTVVIVNYFYVQPIWAIIIAFFILFISIYVVYGITGKVLSQKKK